jgi:ubiquinone/menaquinone biosynthesis C-methylase UbiE
MFEPPRPVCDYEGSRYSTEFWTPEREYEDRAERIALKKLLPPRGGTLIEIGAGAGRLADLYLGYGRIVLMDYARSTLVEARERVLTRFPDAMRAERFLFIAADLYALPFVDGLFDTVTMVRVMHHIADVPAALAGIAAILKPNATFVLEFANKRNLKAILRYLARQQSWSPFAPEPVEFVKLNYDFHPAWMAARLREAGFSVKNTLMVSYFRWALLKRLIPAQALAEADGALQGLGALGQLTPSIFHQLQASSTTQRDAPPGAFFRCPACKSERVTESPGAVTCDECGRGWPVRDGIYEFK